MDTGDTSIIKIPKSYFGRIPTIVAVVAGLSSFATKGCMMYREHLLVEKVREDRLERIERWKCILGYNPPETRNVDRVCKEGKRDVE